MLRSLRKIIGYNVHALDGPVGLCKDFLLNDREWIIRYLIVKTEKWLPGRKVLIEPRFIDTTDWSSRTVKIHCSRVAIESSPRLDMHAPVSHEFETAYFDPYAAPYYRTESMPRSNSSSPTTFALSNSSRQSATVFHGHPISRTYGLQLISEIFGYHVNARNRMIGRVHDFIVEEMTWQIRYLVINIRDWLPAPKVIINPQWFHSIDWNHKTIPTRLTAEQILKSTKFNPRDPVNDKHLPLRYDYYGRPVKTQK